MQIEFVTIAQSFEVVGYQFGGTLDGVVRGFGAYLMDLRNLLNIIRAYTLPKGD